MLKSLRDGAKSTPMRAFLIVLAVGFALWGIDDVFRAVGSSDKAVEVGDVEISAVDAAREFERSRQRFMPQAGTGEAVASGLLDSVLTSLVQQAMFIAEAERLGLAVTREMEKSAIAGEPAFWGEDGRFSTINFSTALARAGLSEESYIRFLRRSLMRDQLMEAVNGGMRYPANSAAAIARWRLERRTVSHATIPVEPGKLPNPGDAEIEAWYAGNRSTFDSPDLRFATVILVGPETFLDEVAIDDAMLAEAYEDRVDAYQRPERRSFRQMIFGAPGEAAAAIARLRGGEDFAALANELQGLSADDINFDEVTRDDLTESLAEAVFTMAEPGVADAIESALGHHVIELVGISPASTVQLEDVKAALRRDLRRELAIDLVYERINSIDEALAAGSTLEEAARDTGARLAILDGMDRNGLNRDGNPVEGEMEELATDTGFRESVWTAPLGEPGIVEESGNENFFVVRVDREEAARPRELDEVRGRVIDSMKLESAITEAREKAAAISAAPDPAAAASDAGYPFSNGVSLRRDGVGLDHASARLIASRAFELGIGEVGYVETGDETIVVATTAVIEADDSATKDEGALFGERLTAEMLESSELAVLRSIEARFKVRINSTTVQRMLIGASN